MSHVQTQLLPALAQLMSMNFCCRQVGHFAACGVPNKRKVAEFRVTPNALLPRGTKVTAAHFTAGQFVDIQGVLLTEALFSVLQ